MEKKIDYKQELEPLRQSKQNWISPFRKDSPWQNESFPYYTAIHQKLKRPTILDNYPSLFPSSTHQVSPICPLQTQCRSDSFTSQPSGSHNPFPRLVSGNRNMSLSASFSPVVIAHTPPKLLQKDKLNSPAHHARYLTHPSLTCQLYSMTTP